MPSVTVPQEFWKQELRVYSNWRTAFWRELLQNAIDANPTKIEIKVGLHATLNNSPITRVTFTDDGCGMDRNTLENVFFQLGRTTKGGDSIGGFGRARIITCFAQERYQILTHDLVVEGQGGDFDISYNPTTYVNGCRFQIDINEDTDSLKRQLQYLLLQCAIQVPLTINGVPYQSTTLPAEPDRVFTTGPETGREDTWANAYVTNKSGSGKILIRVGGLVMYEAWAEGTTNVAVELVPSMSRNTLTASRDSLAAPYRQQLDRFIKDLDQDHRAAFNSGPTKVDEVFVGQNLAKRSFTTRSKKELSKEQIQAYNDQITGIMDELTPDALKGMTPGVAWLQPQVPLPPRTAQTVLPFDVYMVADRIDDNVRGALNWWAPDKMGSRQRALIIAWQAAVEWAIETIVEAHEGTIVNWNVGWGFNYNNLASCETRGNDYLFTLNPVDLDNKCKVRYQLSDKTSRRQLLATALHEVCHIFINKHNEDFAKELTALVGAADQAEGDRRIRQAITKEA